jgi:hypothetical protein
MGIAPDQAPDAAQEVALLDDHVSVDALPLLMVLGLALRLTVAAGFALTVTVADCEALPPAPVQVNVYVELAVSAPVDWDPFIPLLPDHAPEAVQEVALFEVQVSVELLPLLIALGPTLKVTAGAAALTETVTDCTALPPAPLQVRV